MTSPRIYVYACSDPECPEDFRFVAHTLTEVRAGPGEKTSVKRLGLSVATATGKSDAECRSALVAFLEKEFAREEARRRKAEATSERIKAMHAERRAAK